MSSLRLVLATGNLGKLREYEEILGPDGYEIVPFATEVEETGATYAENAALKAVAALEATGLPSLGDDSGIEVDALGGFPGLRSARLGPTQVERTATLLEMLANEPRPWAARFTATIALATPGEPVRTVEGEVRGEVVPEWRGEAGFGYDPVFFVPEIGLTFGEMDRPTKHRLSHRGAAIRALLDSGWLL
ncbi:MAG: RdgB/HAM1 family non-canonical purine NTP pyrophosphatase [Candidatus Dormibacteraeota bacterium]|nr:RdgB/HAM1 family non-canonical purine NTP pyrophosphatase [Candidatus Dormibacteraeota bacterium]